jgi:hypothetical protein
MALIDSFPSFAATTKPAVADLNLAFQKFIDQLGGVGPDLAPKPGNLGLENHNGLVPFRNAQKAERYTAATLLLNTAVPHVALPMDAELVGVGFMIGDRQVGQPGSGLDLLQTFNTIKSGLLTVSVDRAPVGSFDLAGGDWRFPAKPFMWKLSGLVRAGSRLSAVVSDPVTTSATGDVVNPTTRWEPTVTWDLVVCFRVLHGV